MLFFIRNYANNLDTFARNFLRKAGVKKKNLYNTIYSNTDYIKIKKSIYDHFKKF